MVTALEQKHSRIRLRSAAEFLLQTAAMILFLLVLSSFASTSIASAQEPNVPQTKDAGRQTTIKTTVRQVLLDVVVTDGKNQPVTGLRQEDFSILENGSSQKIVFFEPHASLSEASSANLSEAPVLPPNTFVNISPATDKLPLNVLLYDLVNTPIDDQPFAHKEVVKFLRNRPSTNRFAIFVLADTLRLLQGFTDDERQLVAAMHGQEADPHSPASRGSSGDFVDTSEQLAGSALFANNAVAQALLERMGHMEALTRNYFLTKRVELTIAAFEEIARFLDGLPGRKNVIWLSGSFPLNVFPSKDDPLDPFGTAMNYTSDLRQLADRLTVGEVAVYPVDIRGLTVDPVFAAANPQRYRAPAALRQAHGNFLSEIAAEQATMDQIAEDSGGHAFYNTNGLARAMATSTEDGSNYYTLGYSPSNAKFDGGLRKIQVKLAENRYHLAYRHSYLADETVTAEKATRAPTERLQAALRRGVPPAQELSLGAHITPLGKPRPVTKEEIAQIAPFPAFAGRKKWDGVRIQRYLVDYSIQSSRISFETSPDSMRHARLEFLFGAYDSESRTMFGDRSPTQRTFSLEKTDDLQKGTFQVQQLIEIPTGTAWLRLAVRDVIGDRLGSIEIPLPLAAETRTNRTPPQ